MRFVAWMVLVATLMLWSGNWIVARAGVTMHLMPAMGVALAALFLGEYPSWFHFAGIALILAGVALSSLRASSAASTR
jgi:drug/metabolite transporter (DMT)-like permease